MREERSARDVFVGQNLATREGARRAESGVDIGGDCTLEGLSKAARSSEFCAPNVRQGQTEIDCSRAARFVTLRSNLGRLF
jgi:hypothetical protein